MDSESTPGADSGAGRRCIVGAALGLALAALAASANAQVHCARWGSAYRCLDLKTDIPFTCIPTTRRGYRCQIPSLAQTFRVPSRRPANTGTLERDLRPSYDASLPYVSNRQLHRRFEQARRARFLD